MNGNNQDQANTGGEEGGDNEEDNCAECDHSIHLGIEAGCSSDKTGDDKRQDHQLQESHEKLSRVGD